jgi:hypothetical protein
MTRKQGATVLALDATVSQRGKFQHALGFGSRIARNPQSRLDDRKTPRTNSVCVVRCKEDAEHQTHHDLSRARSVRAPRPSAEPNTTRPAAQMELFGARNAPLSYCPIDQAQPGNRNGFPRGFSLGMHELSATRLPLPYQVARILFGVRLHSH